MRSAEKRSVDVDRTLCTLLDLQMTGRDTTMGYAMLKNSKSIWRMYDSMAIEPFKGRQKVTAARQAWTIEPKISNGCWTE
jgi:hypothetical protein